MMHKCPSRYDILDVAWPVIEPRDPEAVAAYAKRRIEEREEALSRINNLTDTNDLDSAISSLESLVSDEQERRQSVQTRLAGTLGFATVAATIALAVASGAIVDVRANFPLPVRVIVGVLAFYVVIQILHVCISSIRGLSRVGYLGVNLGDVLSEHIETSVDRKRRYLQTRVGALQDHQELNNRQVEAMALAHTSARNYIVGIAVFILLDFGHSPRNQIAGKWQPAEDFIADAWEAAQFRDVYLPARLHLISRRRPPALAWSAMG